MIDERLANPGSERQSGKGKSQVGNTGRRDSTGKRARLSCRTGGVQKVDLPRCQRVGRRIHRGGWLVFCYKEWSPKESARDLFGGCDSGSSSRRNSRPNSNR